MNCKENRSENPETSDSATSTLTQKSIRDLINDLVDVRRHLSGMESYAVNMTSKERKRLISAGIRNNGFIDKALDIAVDNPQFIPQKFTAEGLTRNYVKFDELRQLMLVSQQILRICSNAFLQQANIVFHEMLRFYGNLREQTRWKVSEAEPLFKALQNFFRKRRRGGSDLENELEQFIDNTADK